MASNAGGTGYLARPGTPLTAAELGEYEQLAEQEWRAEAVPERYIELSRHNGMDAADNCALTAFTQSPATLIIVRCPKVTARALHRVLRRPKPLVVKIRSDSDGIARVQALIASAQRTAAEHREYISDYDLMSVWRIEDPSHPRRLYISPIDKPVPASSKEVWRGKFSLEAAAFVRSLNHFLVARIQHGCQDDMRSIFNPGVKDGDHFTAFCAGSATYLTNRLECAAYYQKHAIEWLYTASGLMQPEAYRLR